MKMAQDPQIGYQIKVTVLSVKGDCDAGHKEGETFEISCFNAVGLCGWFYHDIFPSLQTFQFGGSLPWWKGDSIQLGCPDPKNLVTIQLQRSKRT
jgi:uncharacterized repeat protein (TIGR04076 family)